jgi:hypothetical protein
MQRVDPFIPIAPTPPQTLRGLVNNIPSRKPRQVSTNLDGFVQRPVIVRPHIDRPTQRYVHTPIAQKPNVTSQRRVIHRRLTTKMQIPLLLVGALLIGVLLESVVVGTICISAYAIFAVVKKIPSRTSFSVAFCLFLGIVGLLLFKNDSTLTGNFSVYAFLLLIVGTIGYSREVRDGARRPG